MCLIIKKPFGRRVASDFLENAWQRNSHGWGCFHLEQGEVVWARGMRLDELIDHNARLPLNAEVYLHLRRATYGEVNHDMTHPYVVRPGLLLMHNGDIAHLAPQDPTLSDTSELARLLRDMLSGLSDAQASGVIRSEGFRLLTAPLIEGSMVILMDTQGAVHLGREWHTVQAAHWSQAMAGMDVSNVHTWGRDLIAGLASAPVDQNQAAALA
jgi:predicted glutamine amidotransferase